MWRFRFIIKVKHAPSFRDANSSYILNSHSQSNPCPFGWPLQIMKGWGVQSLSIWEPLQIEKGWGGPILVHLSTAPNREGFGAPILVHLVTAPNREVLGGCNPCRFARAAPNREELGWSHPYPFGWPLQFVKGWGGPIRVHLGAAPNREGLGGATLRQRSRWQNTRV